MEPLGRSANALTRELHVPTNRVTGVLYASRRVTADTALRLARHFGATPQFWLGLQNQYDLALAGGRAGWRDRAGDYAAHGGGRMVPSQG